MKDSRVFFLKVNRSKKENVLCIKKWIEVCNELGGRVFIICDSTRIRKIIRKNVAHSDEIKFCRSKITKIYRLVNKLYSGPWKSATYAHVFPFFYSNKKGIQNHWDIDADDISICLKKERMCEMMRLVECMAEKDKIDMYSIDIWHSRTQGKHWSFGVVYVRNNTSVYEKISSQKDCQWMKDLHNCDDSYNMDWFCTYLRNKEELIVRTFYVENAILIHWGNFILNPLYSSVILWKRGFTYYPVLNEIIGDERLGKVGINGMDKVDLNVGDEESRQFIQEFLTDLPLISDRRRVLYGM